MKTGIAGGLAKAFINSKLTPLLMIVFLVIGIFSASLTPREEEPQIDVPIADIFIRYQGASVVEVEKRAVKPLEKLVSNIPGVEYVYSTSMPGQAMLIVRFLVGEDTEKSLVKLYNEIAKNMDKMPQGVSMPLIKSKSIDDVPMMALTLWSENYDDFELRRMGLELANEVKKVKDVAETKIIGGRKRQLRVILNKEKTKASFLDPLMIMKQIQSANKQTQSGSFYNNDKEYLVETGNFFESSEDVENLVVGVVHGSPIFLKNIAEIIDGPEEAKEYVSFGLAKASMDESGNYDKGTFPAVTISVSKEKLQMLWVLLIR